MSFPLAQLVSAPSLDAQVRFDFNEDPVTWPDADSFTIGAPSLSGDPGSAAPEYGFRTVAFNLAIRGDESLVLRKQVELARELQRDETYLMFQLSEAARPLWFRCYRTAPGEVPFGSYYRDRDTQDWLMPVTLAADPFAIGEMISFGPVTVGNDPASAGLRYVLPDVEGDAPAPLVVTVEPGTSDYVQPLMSMIPLDATAWTESLMWQAESWTAGTSTAIFADSTASGGSSLRTTLTAEAATERRATGTVAIPYAGRYRVFARVKLTVTAFPPSIRIRGAGPALSSAVTTDVSDYAGRWRIVELGTFAFPLGNMPSERPYSMADATIGIDVGCDAPSAPVTMNLAYDYVVAVPVDLPLDQRSFGRTLEFNGTHTTLGDVSLRINGEVERVEQLSGGAHVAAAPESPAGGYLEVCPGALNVLTVLTRRHDVTTTGTVLSWSRDNLTDATVLSFSYRPRYLYLAGS